MCIIWQLFRIPTSNPLSTSLCLVSRGCVTTWKAIFCRGQRHDASAQTGADADKCPQLQMGANADKCPQLQMGADADKCPQLHFIWSPQKISGVVNCCRCTSSRSSSTAQPRCCQSLCRRCPTGWMMSLYGLPCCSPHLPLPKTCEPTFSSHDMAGFKQLMRRSPGWLQSARLWSHLVPPLRLESPGTPV